ncbi:similar to Saccharomyces cerevisiae YDR349C YPS7 Putative GPI-anchored aspartic protease, member of the yapsin family of proteases involved in cell wall growth and maintenance [Maudiozyma saulgeensis]|uniref:Similar to Saccharomyces cerevisiae YDR349C YPS7 Putative GPI-anchored aspartic protease, member of the yapsin family of proteases involved in cell wall growth and maintenance n=1 Tax=Maudiozyma saulgeensis TaxID=1789683 RepID=A0A1X7R9W1_9SACH|nr:similar to Saccharomyces cerevisiae YDR349C YPS7 Putative GPI-anchored aspartic protease, member of the yapsin family of proteases involved in cell wall growth and maintenance [Kazachstania saulgeensis]
MTVEPIKLLLWWCLLFVPFTIAFSFLEGKVLEGKNYGIKEFPSMLVGLNDFKDYYVNVSVGTPGQIQQLILNTASPYSWVLSGSKNTQCHNHSLCNSGSFYLQERSSTATNYNSDHSYTLGFIDGIAINGTATNDAIVFPNISVVSSGTDSTTKNSNRIYEKTLFNSTENIIYTSDKLALSNLSFINVNQTKNLQSGVLGLGGRITFPNSPIDQCNFDSSFYFINDMVAANIIESASYSLWLNSGRATEEDTNGGDGVSPLSASPLPSSLTDGFGRLLFGAVDPSLYTGQMYQFNMIPFMDPKTGVASTGYPIVPMGPIYMVSKGGDRLNMTSEQHFEPVLLDSSFIGNYLPASTIIQIAIQIGATYVESLDRWLVPCYVQSYGAKIEFTFDNLKIQVPLGDLLSNSTMHYPDKQAACFLRLYANSYIGFNILGQSFLRSTYLAVDLDGNTVGLAQAFSNKLQLKPQPQVGQQQQAVSSSVSASSTPILAAIKSGYIPYAYHKIYNSTSLALYPSSVSMFMSNIPGQYSASVFSNGIITRPMRSFYDTSRSTTTKSSTIFSSSLSLALPSGNITTTMYAAGLRQNQVPTVYQGTNQQLYILLGILVAFIAFNTVL